MAKKQVLQINKFSGGVNSYSDPRDLKENEFQVLDNAAVDEEGIIRVSGGLEVKNNIDLSDDFDTEIPVVGKGLFSHATDYIYNISNIDYNFNSNLELISELKNLMEMGLGLFNKQPLIQTQKVQEN